MRAFIILLFFSINPVYSQSKMDSFYKKNIKIAQCQYNNALKANINSSKIPRTLTDKGDLKSVDIYDWTSGFFAGSLWYLYELTGKEAWKKEAVHWTEILEPIQFWTGNHDVGFMINCSYGNGLRLTGNNEYNEIIINTAKSLSTRFNFMTGCIKSWNYRQAWDQKTEWFFPVIIDNMMNLEILFLASKITGDTTFKEIAITHAKNTMKNHYREDYSCYHVVDYDTITGEVKDKATCQGFTDESSWSRGQAWGLYGFVMCYRETNEVEFLNFAKNIADYILNSPKVPKDNIPYWDYDIIESKSIPEWKYDGKKYSLLLRDSSAAAITSSALLELSTYLLDGKKYYDYANQIIHNLSTNRYRAKLRETNYFILKHSVGSFPHGNEIDVPLNYADYYFLESLLRKRKIDSSKHLYK